MTEIASHEDVDDCELVFDEELLDAGDAPRRAERATNESMTNGVRLPRVGAIIAGKYRVERVPRRSALGVTVEAIHVQLAERVAIKLLLADPRVYPEAVARFLRGARDAVQIRGEHVARVTDVGILDSGAPYMVSEYLRGSDLDGVLRVRERLQVPEAVDYVLQAGEALAEAHALGIVHRNLKPSNLFLTRRSDGGPLIKVLDYCVSEDPFTDSAVNMSGTAGMARSLSCLAPEQIRDPHNVDARADIWALGAILYQLLTGVPVFDADSTPSLLAMIAADVPTAPTALRSEIPSSLESVIMRCLAKDPSVRYGTVGDLAADLEYFASSDGQGSVERIGRTHIRGSRSTRPPPLPSNAPSSARAIVRVPSQPPPALPADSPVHRAPQLMLTGFGFACAAAFGAYVGVRAMQGALGFDSGLAQRALVASLSPALVQPGQTPSATPLAAGSAPAPAVPSSSPPAAQVATPVALVAPRPAARPVPVRTDAPRVDAPRVARSSESGGSEIASSDEKSHAHASAVADAKPPKAASRDLFDDAN
ncbi:MAG TPA: protein kinase [Polyangiaceae bacterium]|jgi:serine/threonine-protein kinase